MLVSFRRLLENRLACYQIETVGVRPAKEQGPQGSVLRDSLADLVINS